MDRDLLTHIGETSELLKKYPNHLCLMSECRAIPIRWGCSVAKSCVSHPGLVSRMSNPLGLYSWDLQTSSWEAMYVCNESLIQGCHLCLMLEQELTQSIGAISWPRSCGEGLHSFWNSILGNAVQSETLHISTCSACWMSGTWSLWCCS